MNIKRYVAVNAKTALKRVRAELGPDAVILQTRRIPEGVEVAVAIEREARDAAAATGPAGGIVAELRALCSLLTEQLAPLAWGKTTRSRPSYASLLRRLLGLGLSDRLAFGIAQTVGVLPDADLAWRQATQVLASTVPMCAEDLLQTGGVVVLVGPTGVGKTTTAAKLAARFALRHGRDAVLLVSTDDARSGAQAQLEIYARILGVPVQSAQDTAALAELIAARAGRRLILIDTAGMNPRAVQWAEHLSRLPQAGVQTLLVLSATTRHAGLTEAIARFGRVPLAGAVITKVDAATAIGPALSALIEAGLPLAYVGDGQHVPEDLRSGDATALVARAAMLQQAYAERQLLDFLVPAAAPAAGLSA